MELKALNRVKALFARFSSGEESFGAGGVLFSRFVYLWFITIGLICWPIIDITFGPDSYTYRAHVPPGLRENLIYILSYQPQHYMLVFSIWMITGVLSFLDLGGMIMRGTFWLSALILAMSSYLVFNAGILLACSWGFFLIFFFPKKNSDWKIVFSNLSILAARVQFLIVYVYAALYKWRIPEWQEGESVHYLSMLDHYTPEWVFWFFHSIPGLLIIMNYVVLLYLTLFPVLIWFKRTKNVLITVGIGFHLYTAFIMRIYDFGFIMLIGYLLFLDKKQITWMEKKLSLVLVYKKIRFRKVT